MEAGYAVRQDKQFAEENKSYGHTICKTCSGTGNMLFFSFKRCDKCHGTGVAETALNVYKMNARHWWADVSLLSACENYCYHFGGDVDEVRAESSRLSEEELKTSTYTYEDEEGNPATITFKRRLLRTKPEPQLFATSHE